MFGHMAIQIHMKSVWICGIPIHNYPKDPIRAGKISTLLLLSIWIFRFFFCCFRRRSWRCSELSACLTLKLTKPLSIDEDEIHGCVFNKDASAMAALGLDTDLVKVRSLGWRPVLLAMLGPPEPSEA